MNENFADMGGILGGVQPGGQMPMGGPMMGEAMPEMMPEMTPDLSAILGTLPPEDPEIRGTVVDWEGGKPIKLDKKGKSGRPLEEELSAHLKETLDQEIQNHKSLFDKLKRWHRLYKAEKRGDRPKPWMADVSIPLARKISDAIYVRVMDMVFNKRKIVLFRSKKEVSAEEMDKIRTQEKAFNNYVLSDLSLKEKMKFPTRQTVNSGTGVVKIVYETKNKTIYRYASDEDRLNSAVKKYRLPGTKDTVVKESAVVFRGPNVYPVDRAKWIISTDATTIEDAYLTGFSFERRKSQLDTLAAKKVYRKEAVEKLTENQPNEMDETRAASAGVELKRTKYTEPYTLWELWLRYDCDNDGEEDDICITFHRESGQILKAIYNPIFYGYRPFVDFKGASQVEYTYDGEGVCEIIEPLSEELDTLHNLMLDRMKLINLPMGLYQTGIGLTDKDLEPGKWTSVDVNPNDAFKIIEQPDKVFTIEREVNWIINQADLVCGVTPASLGISTAERPVAKETMVNQEESNKKFKSWTDNFRSGYRELFYKLLEGFAQYQPEYTYTDENGEFHSVDMPTGNIRDYLDVDLEVSSETMNQEVRREVEVMKYQLMTDYATKMAGMAQALASPQVPSEFKRFILDVNDKGSRSLEKVMSNFDESEAGMNTINLRSSMDVEKCVMMSVDLMPQPGMGPMGGPGQPPGPAPASEGALGM